MTIAIMLQMLLMTSPIKHSLENILLHQNILRIIALILKVLIKYQKMIIIRLLLGVKLINGILL